MATTLDGLGCFLQSVNFFTGCAEVKLVKARRGADTCKLPLAKHATNQTQMPIRKQEKAVPGHLASRVFSWGQSRTSSEAECS